MKESFIKYPDKGKSTQIYNFCYHLVTIGKQNMFRSCARLFSHIHTDGLRSELKALHGISSSGLLYRNLKYADLRSHEQAYKETELVNDDRVNVVHTGEFTGRSPKDKYFVYYEGSESGKKIDWNKINQKISPATYHRLEGEVKHYLSESDRLYIYDGYLGYSGPPWPPLGGHADHRGRPSQTGFQKKRCESLRSMRGNTIF